MIIRLNKNDWGLFYGTNSCRSGLFKNIPSLKPHGLSDAARERRQTGPEMPEKSHGFAVSKEFSFGSWKSGAGFKTMAGTFLVLLKFGFLV